MMIIIQAVLLTRHARDGWQKKLKELTSLYVLMDVRFNSLKSIKSSIVITMTTPTQHIIPVVAIKPKAEVLSIILVKVTVLLGQKCVVPLRSSQKYLPR